MTESDLIKQYLRTVPFEDGLALEVQRVHWHGPHTPVITWHRVRTLSDSATEEELETAYLETLRNGRWFGVCATCRERKPRGFMDDAHHCQHCRESWLDTAPH